MKIYPKILVSEGMALSNPTVVVLEPGEGPGGSMAPQYFADQLTLFELGKADYPHLLLLAPNVFHLPASLCCMQLGHQTALT